MSALSFRASRLKRPEGGFEVVAENAVLIKDENRIREAEAVHDAAPGEESGKRNPLSAGPVLSRAGNLNLRADGAGGIHHFARAERYSRGVFHHALRGLISRVKALCRPLGRENRLSRLERVAVPGAEARESTAAAISAPATMPGVLN